MQICLVCREYPPDTVGGGIGTYTANVARGLARAGHKVSVVARAVRGTESRNQEDGVLVHRVAPTNMQGLSWALRRLGDGKTFADAYLYSQAVASKVRGLMMEGGLDVIQSPEHGAEGFALAVNGITVAPATERTSPEA